MADAAVAELEQVAEGRLGAALGVEAHRRASRRPGLDEHDVLVGAHALGWHDLEQQVAVDRAGAQRLEGLLLPAPVIARVDQRHGVAGLLGRALGPAQDAGEERVGHIGDQQRDRARAAQPQRLRGDVGPVAELAGAAPHPLLRGRRDATAALAREHERDRRLRDAGTARDVDARHAAVGGGGDGDMQPRRTVGRGGKHRRRRASHRREGLVDKSVIRSMLIRMTGVVSALVSFAAAGALAVASVLAPGAGHPAPRTALVVDAPAARDGRALVDPRLRTIDGRRPPAAQRCRGAHRPALLRGPGL